MEHRDVGAARAEYLLFNLDFPIPGGPPIREEWASPAGLSPREHPAQEHLLGHTVDQWRVEVPRVPGRSERDVEQAIGSSVPRTP